MQKNLISEIIHIKKLMGLNENPEIDGYRREPAYVGPLDFEDLDEPNTTPELTELARYIKTPDYKTRNFDYEDKPLKNTDVIKVYHGFNSIDDALIVARQGLSGKSNSAKHKIYSYETGNNPYGLFVSVNFDVIKRNFAHGGVIMEFSAKVSDLEAPVWKGQGSYFTQGQYTQSFKDREDRETARQEYRAKILKDYGDGSLDSVLQSDRPELAALLYDSPEKQAIFIGDLNPNMINLIWVHENIINNRITTGSFKPMKRVEFLNKYKDTKIGKYQQEKHERRDTKLFYPNDDFNLDKLNVMNPERMNNPEYYIPKLKKIINDFDNENSHSTRYFLTNLLWPKQIIQAIGAENYRQNFNEFYNDKIT